MDLYDPDSPPDPTRWLEADESERIDQVLSYHRLRQIKVPNANLHATIHVIVENQLALEQEVVVRTLGRLMTEGLTRHDALHAIGSVLVEDIYELLHEDTGPDDAVYRRYLRRLDGLSGKRWLER